LTLEDLGSLFEDIEFMTVLYRLFEFEESDTLTISGWTKNLRTNLGLPNDDKFADLDNLIESVAHFKAQQETGILNPTLLQQIFITKGVPNMLFQTLVGNSEETTLSSDTLMTFLIGATSPRGQKRISAEEVKNFIDYFRKHAGSKLCVDREGFRKLISKGNSDYYSERIFSLVDQNKDNRVCIDEYTEFMTKLSTDDQNGMIEFLFKIFDTDDDGGLSASDMAEALKASLSASKMTFDETQVQELVAALWEDAGLDNLTDSMDLAGLHALLSQHEGLVEGLVKSITTLVLPPKEREKRKETQLSLSDRWQNLKSTWSANIQLYSFYVFIVAMNVILASRQFIVFHTMWGLMWRPKPEDSTDSGDKGGMVNFFYMTSRAMGLTMDFNTMMVITMILRHSLTTLRKLGLAKIVPIDNNIWLHKVFGWTLFAQAWIHTIAHLLNIGFNVSPAFHADADPVYWARRNFKLAGYRLLDAYRPPDG